MKRRVLFLCTGNSCRSQMAEAIVNARLGDAWEAVSAGTEPAGYVHPKAVAALAEIGVDWRGHTSKHADQLRDVPFDLVVTVCDDAAENCPVWLPAPGTQGPAPGTQGPAPGTQGQGRRAHLGFPDPAKATGTEDEVMAAFRAVRDAIAEQVPALLREWNRVG